MSRNQRERHPASDSGQIFPSWESTLRHVETGYRNAQDIIKFVDAKAGVVAGFAFVGLGLVLQIVKEFFEAKDGEQQAILALLPKYSFPLLVVSFSTILSLAAGVASIWCVVRCITARQPKDLGLKLKHTFLFPFCEDAASAKEYYKRIHVDLKPQDIAAEYEEQILQVGLIQCTKIAWMRRAANCFLAELTFLVIAIASFIIQILTFSQ